MNQEMNIMKNKYVVVTTEYKGVFWGRLESREGNEVTLTGARVCVYWSPETRGFVGLAVTGPMPGSRVSAACPRMAITAVTSITECTEEAVALWEEGPWS
jgi:hypothetical protein